MICLLSICKTRKKLLFVDNFVIVDIFDNKCQSLIIIFNCCVFTFSETVTSDSGSECSASSCSTCSDEYDSEESDSSSSSISSDHRKMREKLKNKTNNSSVKNRFIVESRSALKPTKVNSDLDYPVTQHRGSISQAETLNISQKATKIVTTLGAQPLKNKKNNATTTATRKFFKRRLQQQQQLQTVNNTTVRCRFFMVLNTPRRPSS